MKLIITEAHLKSLKHLSQNGYAVDVVDVVGVVVVEASS